MAQYVTSEADANAVNTYGTRYVFATLNQNELSATTRVDWTFTPRLSLQVFAQPLIASGDFTDFKEFARPRQFTFDVYGRDVGTITRDAAAEEYTVDPDGAGSSPPFTFGDPNFNSGSCAGTRCCDGNTARLGPVLGLAAEPVRVHTDGRIRRGARLPEPLVRDAGQRVRDQSDIFHRLKDSVA